MKPLINAYCKLACFQMVKSNKYNICKCFPHCSVLNNTLSTTTSAYILGPDAKNTHSDCFCKDKCKQTQINIPYKLSH